LQAKRPELQYPSVRPAMLACGAAPDLATSFGEATPPLRMLATRTTIEMIRRTTTPIKATTLHDGLTRDMGDTTIAIPRSQETPTTTTLRRAYSRPSKIQSVQCHSSRQVLAAVLGTSG